MRNALLLSAAFGLFVLANGPTYAGYNSLDCDNADLAIGCPSNNGGDMARGGQSNPSPGGSDVDTGDDNAGGDDTGDGDTGGDTDGNTGGDTGDDGGNDGGDGDGGHDCHDGGDTGDLGNDE